MVLYHMIGRLHSMESGILGGYVDFILRTHPTAPIPGVFLAEKLLRRRPPSPGHGWVTRHSLTSWTRPRGARAAGVNWSAPWDAMRFDAAMEADPGSRGADQSGE